jgi:hypothetical protein
MKLLLSAALVATSAFAASVPVSEVVSECVLKYRSVDGGYVMQFSQRDNPVVKVYAPDGRFRLNLTVQSTKAEIPRVYDVAVDSDGSFGVAAAALGRAEW